jgi:hypothetical protein
MKILIYIEPVVFRSNPIAGITWVRDWGLAIARGLGKKGNSFALVSSQSLIDLVADQASELELQFFPISSWSILSSCDYRRDLYSISLFEDSAAREAIAGNGPLALLAEQLTAINLIFKPDLVFAMAENKLLFHVFSNAQFLWVDRAPFLRQKRRDRLYLDPCGHQTGSVLQQAADKILNLDIPSKFLPQIEALWRAMQAPPISQFQRASEIRQAIYSLRSGRDLALFILQPIDWFSWEGCLGYSVQPEAMLAQWAESLPEGWIGIPLYKAHARLSPALEKSLADAFPELIFLPSELSGDVAAWALQEADAIVTVSSSMAGQALISGKQVVVTGNTCFRTLALNNVQDLACKKPTLSRRQRLALLAFLSHRYIFTIDEISNPDGQFPRHITSLLESLDPVSWLLDLSDWSPERLARLL